MGAPCDGKLVLGAEVGRLLYNEGQFPGGTFHVDLRNVTSLEAVEAK